MSNKIIINDCSKCMHFDEQIDGIWCRLKPDELESNGEPWPDTAYPVPDDCPILVEIIVNGGA